jgi:hypothetical protein
MLGIIIGFLIYFHGIYLGVRKSNSPFEVGMKSTVLDTSCPDKVWFQDTVTRHVTRASEKQSEKNTSKRILKTQQKNYFFHPNMWLINYVGKGP